MKEHEIDESDGRNSISSTLRTAVKVAISGFSPAADYDARITLCKGCKNRDVSKSHLTCSLCGCTMEIKAKFSVTNCPVGKW